MLRALFRECKHILHVEPGARQVDRLGEGDLAAERQVHGERLLRLLGKIPDADLGQAVELEERELARALAGPALVDERVAAGPVPEDVPPLGQELRDAVEAVRALVALVLARQELETDQE